MKRFSSQIFSCWERLNNKETNPSGNRLITQSRIAARGKSSTFVSYKHKIEIFFGPIFTSFLLLLWESWSGNVKCGPLIRHDAMTRGGNRLLGGLLSPWRQKRFIGYEVGMSLLAASCSEALIRRFHIRYLSRLQTLVDNLLFNCYFDILNRFRVNKYFWAFNELLKDLKAYELPFLTKSFLNLFFFEIWQNSSDLTCITTTEPFITFLHIFSSFET